MSTNALFTPLKVGDATLKNRITMSALTRNRALDTYPTELIKEHYTQRSGAGLIVSEGILVSPQGTEWPHAPGLWDDKHVACWKNVTDSVHGEKGIIYAQLWHTGRVSHPEMKQQKLAGVPVYGPSAIAARGGKFRSLPGMPGYITPTPHPNPRDIVQQFKHSAINAKKAGFDGVEIHSANGYILHQFIDKTSNTRTDEWGGSVENRCRLALEVVKAAKDVFGRNVGIKLTPFGGYNDMGMPLEDTIETFKYLIEEVDKLDIGYICLTRYVPFLDAVYDGVSRATKHDILETYRPFVKKTPFIINGAVTAEEGEKLVAEGKADAIAIGTAYISHPDLAERIQHGKPLDNVLNFAHMQTTDTTPVEEWRIGYNDYSAAVY